MRTVLIILFLTAGLAGCTADTETNMPVSGETIRDLGLPANINANRETAPSQQTAKAFGEGSSGRTGDSHPEVDPGQFREREIFIPKDLEGKWKAVKILIRNKKDADLTEIRTVNLGTSFQLAGGGMKVTVGPYFPNFVMNETTYSSMDNQQLNPAVQLVVEENGKILYKGWAFEKFPSLYGFEHDTYRLELLGSIPAEVS